MRDILKLGIILMLYSVTAGALLAVVYLKTAPIIAANKEAAAGGDVLNEVLPGMDGGFTKQGADTDFPYWVGFTDAAQSQPGGYVFITSQKGYSSTIEAMVGVDADLTITGLQVLFQQETPGLGDKVTQPSFQKQFIGMGLANTLAVTKDDGEIEAISGATISSRAITLAIKNGLNQLDAVLSGGEFVAEEVDLSEEPADSGPVELALPDDDTVLGVMPGMVTTIEIIGEDTTFPYWIGYFDDAKTRVMGYAFIAIGDGFASTVQTLVGTDDQYTISGISVLSQNETSGYGTRIVDEIRDGESEPWFMKQFVGLSPADEIALKADGGVVDGLTEATITSGAVTTSIDEGLTMLADVISGKVTPETAAPSGPSVDDDMLIGVMHPMVQVVELVGEGSDFPYWVGYMSDDKADAFGYAFVAEGDGFASTIETLVGVDPDGTITGLQILSQGETPGYGTRMVEEINDGESEPWFPAQFVGKAASETALADDGGAIDALSGATISSQALTESVADGIKTLLAVISGEAPAPQSGATETDTAPILGVLPAGTVAVEERSDGDFAYWAGFSDDGKSTLTGYAFTAEGEGFASTIETLVGVDTNGVITGVTVVSQDETPGWGTRVVEEINDGETEPWFPKQFVGKSASDNIALTADGGVIDALSGATVSSTAVTQSIATGLGSLMTAIQ